MRRLADKVGKSRPVRVFHALSDHTLARLYELGDRVEKALPGRLGKAFGRLRLYGPVGLTNYAFYKFKHDPGFLGTYAVAESMFGHLRYPLLLSMGMSPSLVLPVGFALGLPVDLLVLTLREHMLRRRENPDQTLRQTIGDLHRQYERFSTHRKRLLIQRAKGRSLVDQLRQALRKPAEASSAEGGAAAIQPGEPPALPGSTADLFEEGL